MNAQPTRVFISYSRDSDRLVDRVLEFSEQLRKDGIDSRIDRYEHCPPEGWPQWCIRQVEESEFVLVVCTETLKRRFEGKEVLGRGKGGSLEGNVILQMIFDDNTRNVKFIPIAFRAEELEFIPLILRGSAFYNVSRVREYDALYRRLTHRPPVEIMPIRPRKYVSSEANASIVSAPPLGSFHPLPASRRQQSRVDLTSALGRTSYAHEEPQSSLLESKKVPTIYAKFELSDGNPVIRKRGAYKIWVAVKNVPVGTRKVDYEILDDTFAEPKFSVRWGAKDFADWITSYGDIFLTAKGKGEKGSWRSQTTLLEALQIGCGPKPKPSIHKALIDIANN